MPNYVFAGHALASSIVLPELPRPKGTASARDLSVSRSLRARRPPRVRRWHHQWRDESGRPIFNLFRDEGGFLLRFPGACDFEIASDAKHVVVQPHRSISRDTLQHLLIDQVLPRCLAQRGELLLHAACIGIDGHAALFVGESGLGKSTIAAMFSSRGHACMTDDCVAVRPGARSVKAVPTYPSLRLNRDSAAAIFPRKIVEPGGWGKRRIAAASRTSRAPSRVGAVYYLEDRRSTAVRIRTLSPSDACIRLMEQSFQLDVAETAAVRRLLTKAAAVAAGIPAFALDYPRDYTRGDELLDSLTNHFRSLVDGDRGGRPGG